MGARESQSFLCANFLPSNSGHPTKYISYLSLNICLSFSVHMFLCFLSLRVANGSRMRPVKRQQCFSVSSRTRNKRDFFNTVLSKLLEYGNLWKKRTPSCRLRQWPQMPREGEGTPYSGLYGKAPHKRGTFFRLQVYERVGILLFKVYERGGKSVILCHFGL